MATNKELRFEQAQESLDMAQKMLRCRQLKRRLTLISLLDCCLLSWKLRVEDIMSRFVAISMPEGLEIHMPDPTGNYMTLCGLDGADEDPTVQQKVVPVPSGRKIDCRQCKSIWEVARKFRAADFC